MRTDTGATVEALSIAQTNPKEMGLYREWELKIKETKGPLTTYYRYIPLVKRISRSLTKKEAVEKAEEYLDKHMPGWRKELGN